MDRFDIVEASTGRPVTDGSHNTGDPSNASVKPPDEVAECLKGYGLPDVPCLRAVAAEVVAKVAFPLMVKEAKKSYGWAYVVIPEDVRNAMKKIRDSIAPDDLHEDGKEGHPHVTSKYGLTGDDPDEVKKAVASNRGGRVRMGKTSLFEKEDQDVLKVSVTSHALHSLWKSLSKLDNEDQFDEYVPHATLAYLKPGMGKKYAGLDGVDGMEFDFDSFMFEDAKDNPTKIELDGKVPVTKTAKAREDVVKLQSKLVDNHGENYAAFLVWKAGGKRIGDNQSAFGPAPNQFLSMGDVIPTLRVESSDGKTYGRHEWYFDGAFMDKPENIIFLDAGQGWYVEGLNAVCQEGKKVLMDRKNAIRMVVQDDADILQKYPFEFDISTDDMTIGSVSKKVKVAGEDIPDDEDSFSHEGLDQSYQDLLRNEQERFTIKVKDASGQLADPPEESLRGVFMSEDDAWRFLIQEAVAKPELNKYRFMVSGNKGGVRNRPNDGLLREMDEKYPGWTKGSFPVSTTSGRKYAIQQRMGRNTSWFYWMSSIDREGHVEIQSYDSEFEALADRERGIQGRVGRGSERVDPENIRAVPFPTVDAGTMQLAGRTVELNKTYKLHYNNGWEDEVVRFVGMRNGHALFDFGDGGQTVVDERILANVYDAFDFNSLVVGTRYVVTVGMTDNNVEEGVFSGLTERGHPKFELDNGSEISINPVSVRRILPVNGQPSSGQSAASVTPTRYMIQHEFDSGWDYFGDGIEHETYASAAEAQEEINQVVADSRGTGAEYESDQFRVVPCLFQIQRENANGEWAPVEGEPLVESASDATSRIMVIMELDSDGNYRGLPVPAEDQVGQTPIVQEEAPAREPTWVYQERALTEGQIRDLGLLGRGRTVHVTFARTSISERNRIGNRQDPELNRALAPMGITLRPPGRSSYRVRLVSTDGLEALRANPMFADSVQRFYVEHNMARSVGGEVWRRNEASYGTVGEALSQMAVDVSHEVTQSTSNTRVRNARVVDGSGNERLNASTAMNTWLIVHDTGNIIGGEVPRPPMNAQFRRMYDALVAVERNMEPGENFNDYKIVGAWSGRAVGVPEARRMHNMGVGASAEGLEKKAQFDEEFSSEDFASSMDSQYQQELLREKAKQDAKNEELKERARREQAKQSIPETPSMAFENLMTGVEYEWEPYRRDASSPVPMPTRGILINTRHNPLSLKFEDADGSTFWVEWNDLRRVVPVSIEQRNVNTGHYVTFSFDNAGNLVMTPTPAGVEEASEMKQNGRIGTADFLSMIDDHLSNGWQLVSPEDVGAMTDALIITNDMETDDRGNMTSVGDLWSNISHHQVTGEVDEFAEGSPVTWGIVDQSGQVTGFSVRNLDSNEEGDWFPDLAGASDWARDSENQVGRKVIMDLATNQVVEPVDSESMRWVVRNSGFNWGLGRDWSSVVVGRTMSRSEANALMDWFVSDEDETIQMLGLVPVTGNRDLTGIPSANVNISRIDGDVVRQQIFIQDPNRPRTSSTDGVTKKAQFEEEFSAEDFAASMDAQYQQELLKDEKSKEQAAVSRVHAPDAQRASDGKYIVQRVLRDSGRWRTVEWGQPESSFANFEEAASALVSHLQERPSRDGSEYRIIDRDTGEPVYETPVEGVRWLYAATPITSDDADRNLVPRELVGQTSITFTPATYWRAYHAVSDQHHQDMVAALALYGIEGEETENEYVINNDQLLRLSNDPRFGTDQEFFRWVTQREPAQAARPRTGFSVQVVDMDGSQARPIALYPDLIAASDYVLNVGGQNEVRRIIVDLSTGRQVAPVDPNSARFVVEYRRIGYQTFTTIGRARTRREADALMNGFMEDVRDIHTLDIRVVSLVNGAIVRQETFVPARRQTDASADGMKKEAQFEFEGDIPYEISSEDFAASMDEQYQRELELEKGRAIEKANREKFVVQYHTTYGWIEVQWNQDSVETRPSRYETEEAARTAINESIADDEGRSNPRPTIASYRVYSTKKGVLPNPPNFGFKVYLGHGADKRWETIHPDSSSFYSELQDGFNDQAAAEEVLRDFLSNHPKLKPRDFKVVDRHNVDTDLPVIDENAAEESFYVQWSRRGNFEFLRNGVGELMKFSTKDDARQFCQTVHGDKRIVSNREGIVDEVGGIGEPPEEGQEAPAFQSPYHIDIRAENGGVTRWHTARGRPFAEADQAWGAANEWIQMSENRNAPRSAITVVDDNDRPVPRPPVWGPAEGEGFTPPFRVQYRTNETLPWRQFSGGGSYPAEPAAQEAARQWISRGYQNVRIVDGHGHVMDVETNDVAPTAMNGPFRMQLLTNDGIWMNEFADTYDLAIDAWNFIGTHPNGIPNSRRRVVDVNGEPVLRPVAFGEESNGVALEPVSGGVPTPSVADAPIMAGERHSIPVSIHDATPHQVEFLSSSTRRWSWIYRKPNRREAVESMNLIQGDTAVRVRRRTDNVITDSVMPSPRTPSPTERFRVEYRSNMGWADAQTMTDFPSEQEAREHISSYVASHPDYEDADFRVVSTTRGPLRRTAGTVKQAQFEEEFSSEDFAASMDAQYQQELTRENATREEQSKAKAMEEQANAGKRYVVKWYQTSGSGHSWKMPGRFASVEEAGTEGRRYAASHPEMAKGLFSVQVNDGSDKWTAGIETLELYLMGSQLEVGTHYEWSMSPGYMGKTKGMFLGLTREFMLRFVGYDTNGFIVNPWSINTIRAADGAAGRSPADGMFVSFSSSRIGAKAMLDARALMYPDVGESRSLESMMPIVMGQVDEWCANLGVDPVGRWSPAVKDDFESQMRDALTSNPPLPPSSRPPLNEIRGIGVPNDLVVGQSYEWTMSSGSRGMGAFVRKSNDEQPILTFSRMPNADGVILFEEGFEIPWADIREISTKPIRSVLDLEPGSVYSWSLNNTNSGSGVFQRVSREEGLAVFRHVNDPHNRMGEWGLNWRDIHSLNKVAVTPARDAVLKFDEFNGSGEGREIFDEVLSATDIADKAGEVMARAGAWYEDEHPEDAEGWALMSEDFRILVERELSSFGSPQAIAGRIIFGSFLRVYRGEVDSKISYLQANRNVEVFTSSINELMVLADAWWQRTESAGNPRNWLETWNGVRGYVRQALARYVNQRGFASNRRAPVYVDSPSI